MRDGREAVLRPLRRGDLEATFDFANELYHERGRNPDLGIVSLDRRVTRAAERRFLERVTSDLRKDDAVSVAAFDGPRLVGNCEVTRRRQLDMAHCGVLGIAILEEFRGVGLGEAMVARALAGSARAGITLVELQVLDNNAFAKRLYQKAGFKVVGTVPGKIRRSTRSIDEVLMYIDLTRPTKDSAH